MQPLLLPASLLGWGAWGEAGFKLALAAGALAGALLVAGVAARLWGRASAWWVAAFWLTLPFPLSLLYQWGTLPFLEGLVWLLLAILLAMGPRGRGRWLLVAVGLLLAGWRLGQSQPPLAPYHLLAATGPDPTQLRAWLEAPSVRLGPLPLALAGVAVAHAWPRRADPVARRVLALGALLATSAGLALAGGPVLLWASVATIATALVAGSLPRLDPRYAAPPVQVGLLALAAIALYPTLQPAWYDPLPSLPAAPTALFGDKELMLLTAEGWQEGDTLIVEALWQAVGQPRLPYTAFVQFLGPDGSQVAQADALLLDEEAIPAPGWPAGYLVRQRYVTSSTALAASVRFGLYDRETLARLPAISFAASGEPEAADSLLLPVHQGEAP